jgi:peptide subunit release factor 1 (eRF1)
MKAKCPDCDVEFETDNDYKVGDIMSCPCCGLELEVKSITDGIAIVQELTIEGEDWELTIEGEDWGE